MTNLGLTHKPKHPWEIEYESSKRPVQATRVELDFWASLQHGHYGTTPGPFSGCRRTNAQE